MRVPSKGFGQPESLQALHDRALLCLSRGNPAGAEKLCLEALARNSGNVGILNLLGQSQLALRKPAEAAEAFRKALGQQPELPNLHFNLALALQADGRVPDAVQSVQRAIDLDPNVPVLHSKLGQLLCSVGANSEAATVLRRAMALDGDSVPIRINLAQALTDLGEMQEAEALVKEALRLKPEDAIAHRLLGRIHQLEGRLQEAGASFREAIRLDPRQAAAYFALVYSAKIHEADRRVVHQIEHLLSEGAYSGADRGLLHYAAGKAYDDLGEYEKAIGHFDKANEAALDALHKTGRSYDPVEEAGKIDRIIERFTPEFLANSSFVKSASKRPVFIVGMIRSGTTLVEQILSSHADIDAAGELSFWLIQELQLMQQAEPLQELPTLAAEFEAVLEKASSTAARVTDKMPLNFRAMGWIHMAFPEARFVHCQRHPVDTCISVYVTPYRGSPEFGHDRANIVAAYQQYLRLMEHWRKVIPASRLLEIQYEDLVADREAKAREIIEFIGLPWDEACLDPEANKRSVNTPSLWQVRQPVYRTSVERWKNYEPYLGPLRELLP